MFCVQHWNCPLALSVFSIGYLDCWTMIIVVLFMRCNVGQSKAATLYYCRKSRRKVRTHVVNHINLMANEQNPIYSTQKHSSMITTYWLQIESGNNHKTRRARSLTCNLMDSWKNGLNENSSWTEMSWEVQPVWMFKWL